MFGKKQANTDPIPVQTGGTTRYRAAGGDGVTTYKTAAEAKKAGETAAAIRNANQRTK